MATFRVTKPTGPRPGKERRHRLEGAAASDSTSSSLWDHLEAFVRDHIQRFIQALLEEEMTTCYGLLRIQSTGHSIRRFHSGRWPRHFHDPDHLRTHLEIRRSAERSADVLGTASAILSVQCLIEMRFYCSESVRGASWFGFEADF